MDKTQRSEYCSAAVQRKDRRSDWQWSGLQRKPRRCRIRARGSMDMEQSRESERATCEAVKAPQCRRKAPKARSAGSVVGTESSVASVDGPSFACPGVPFETAVDACDVILTVQVWELGRRGWCMISSSKLLLISLWIQSGVSVRPRSLRILSDGVRDARGSRAPG